jgi:hypothetical protein
MHERLIILYQIPRVVPVILGLILSLASDSGYSIKNVFDAFPGYLALLLYAILTCVVEYSHSHLSLKLGAMSTSSACVLGAAMAVALFSLTGDMIVSNI